MKKLELVGGLIPTYEYEKTSLGAQGQDPAEKAGLNRRIRPTKRHRNHHNPLQRSGKEWRRAPP